MQDSTGLGIKIEKAMWGAWTPAKVKMGVSGCPRNCAEATCKDFGVVCIESGYELHFAGAAGMDIKGTEILCRVTTEEEALEHGLALVQLYREQGRYLERIYKWAKRVGIDTVRAQIAEDHDRRRALAARFRHSPDFCPGRPLGRARQRPRCARVPCARRPHRPGSCGMTLALANRPSAEWVDIGAAADILPRSARVVRTARGEVAVFRTATDVFYAVDNRCPHRGGPLSEGIVHGDAVTCPLHNWVISLATGKALGADEGCVATLPVKVDDGRLFLALAAVAAAAA